MDRSNAAFREFGLRGITMIKKWIAYLLCGAMVFAAGCAAETPTPSVTPTASETVQPEELLTINESDYPRVDGSTATIPLGEAVAAVLMEKSRAACADYAAFTGTDSAYWNLLDKAADLLIIYDASKKTEELLLEGVNRADGEEHSLDTARFETIDDVFNRAAIGSDGLVFLVNAANPVDHLTSEQLRDIYAGKITNWQEVGGDDAEIAPFQRNATAGSQAMIEALLMGDAPMMRPREDFVAETMGGLITAVSDFDTGQNAIGYNVYYYVTEMKNDPNIKILAVDGVSPDKETIRDKTYPLVNDFYAVIRKDEPKESPAHAVFDWLQGEEGQALIDLEGYAAK
jgi:phosphate transport system substrate-binding protein